MRYFSHFFFLLLLILSPQCAELTIRVTTPDGKPAAGVEVYQFQIERSCNMHGESLGKTNKNGIVRVQFQDRFSKWVDKIGGYDTGYGLYEFIALPKNYRWEISDWYYWIDPEENRKYLSLPPIHKVSGWTENPRGNAIPRSYKVVDVTKEAKLTWEIALNSGVDCTVTFLDQFKEPIADYPFQFGIRQHEFPSFVTDASGTVRLKHINPEYIYDFWSKDYFEYFAPNQEYRYSQVGQRLHEGNNEVQYTKAQNYKITVKVIDKVTGKAISKAVLGTTLYFPTAYQGGPIGRGIKDSSTNDEGIFHSHEFQTDHTGEFWVHADGYELESRPISEFKPGGYYVFEMSRKKGGKEVKK